MLNKAVTQAKLDQLLTKLKNWENSVPIEAKKFHQQRQELLSLIEHKLGRWFAWLRINENEISGFEQDCDNLALLVDDLVKLFPKKAELVQKINQFHPNELIQADQELQLWLTERCDEWQRRLSKLGVDCIWESQLHADSAELMEIQKQFIIHNDAVHWLKQADVVLETLGSCVETAQLEADFPTLRQRLLEEGASHDWLKELTTLVQPLQSQVTTTRATVTQTSQVLGNVSSKLHDLGGWSKQLDGLFKTEIEVFRQRHHLLNHEKKNLEEVTQLEEEVTSLLGKMREEAHKIRQNEVVHLEELIHKFFFICGSQPDLEKNLGELKQRQIERHHQQKQWMLDFKNLKDHFKSLAELSRNELEERLEEAIAVQKNRLTQLQEKRLAQMVREKAEKLLYQVQKLSSYTDLEENLYHLQKIEQFGTEIQDLEKQAGHDLEDIAESQKRLEKRNTKNQEIAEQINYKVSNLAKRIAELTKGSSDDKNLEEAQNLIVELETELDLQEKELAEQCQNLLQQRLEHLEKFLASLQNADMKTAVQRFLSMQQLATVNLETLLRAISQADELLETVENEIGGETKSLIKRKEKLRQRLQEMDVNTLTPADRAEVDDFVASLVDLEQDISAPDVNDLEYLEELSSFLERIEDFFLRLEVDEKEIKAYRDNLCKRFRSFNNRGLDKPLQIKSLNVALSWIAKVEALVYAEPAHPQQWKNLRHQLEYAENLLEKLENQAAWLAAQELDELIKNLEHQIHASRNNHFVAKAQAVLDEVKKYTEEELPPLRLRFKLEQLTKERH